MAFGRDLRRGVFRKVDAASPRKDVNVFGAPTLITRGTNDVQQVQMLMLMALNFMVATPIMCIGGIFMALREDLNLSWLVWVSVPLLVVVVGYLVVRLMPLFRSMQKKIDRLNGILREQIIGIRVVRAFVREPHEAERFGAANKDLTDVSLKIGALFVLMFPAIGMILHISTAAVLWFGGQRVDAGEMQVGSLTAFLQYLLQILMAVMMGTFMAMMIPRASVCADRIGEVLDVEPSIHEALTPVAPAAKAGRVEFRNVSFAYPGAEAPVLSDISFTAEPGQTVAIIGSTGAGKSSLLALLPAPLRRRLGGGAARRRPRHPAGPRGDHAARGHGAAAALPVLRNHRAQPALRQARGHGRGALGRADGRPGRGLRAREEERARLHGSPRAAPTSPAASASGSASPAPSSPSPRSSCSTTPSPPSTSPPTPRLRRALKAKTADATVIIVGQRVSTIADADQILVLDNGRIVDRGTHEELLESSSTYQEIVESQLTAEAVA